MKCFIIKISSLKMIEKLTAKFKNIRIDNKNSSIVYVPCYLKTQFYDELLLIRNIEKINNFSGNEKLKSKTKRMLMPYRGDFDIEVNAYRINGIVPKQLFGNALEEKMVFSIRFKNEMLKEGSKEYALIWYIREDVNSWTS